MRELCDRRGRFGVKQMREEEQSTKRKQTREDRRVIRDGRLAPKWVKWAPNVTNSGLFQFRFEDKPKCTEI